MSFVFQDAEKETFYQDILKKIDEESDDNDAKAKKKQKKKEAKNADRSYGDLLSSLENFANNKNLKEFEGITYPNDFLFLLPAGCSFQLYFQIPLPSIIPCMQTW